MKNNSSISTQKNVQNFTHTRKKPIPVAAPLRRGSAAARFLGLRVRILPKAWVFFPL